MTTMNRAFGIELEVKGCDNVRTVQNNLADKGITTWQVKYDGSVDDGVEVVSPKLYGPEGLAEVEKVVNLLREMGLFVDHQCGFHVHVDASGLNGHTLANIVKRYAAFEETIDSWMTTQRRENNNHFLNSCKQVAVSPVDNARMTANQLGGRRYYKVNLAAFIAHGTVEFRQHYGTLSVEEIQGWIQFCINFMNNSITTVTEVVIPGDGSLRANAIERKFAGLVQAFLATSTVYTSDAARILGCAPEQVPVYFSRFRAWLSAQGVGDIVYTCRGRGYMVYSSDYGQLRPLLNHPGLDRKEFVLNFEEPGLLHGLSQEVRENLEGRAEAYKLLSLFTETPAALAA